METITTNAKPIELTGEETQVHFSSAFPYFWVRNDGSSTVLMSVSPNIEEGKDGVIEVLAGSSAGTMHGYNDTRSDFYILGSGKVQIIATYTPENPFRKARKGGEITGGGNAKIILKATMEGSEMLNGLTGFELINDLPEISWRIATLNEFNRNRFAVFATILEKGYSVSSSDGGYFDSALFATLDEFDLTNFNYILVDFYSISNYSTNKIDSFGGAYFRLDEPEELPQPHVSYDWSDWDIMSQYNSHQGVFVKDVSKINGSHKLYFGVCQGGYVSNYANALALLNIILF